MRDTWIRLALTGWPFDGSPPLPQTPRIINIHRKTHKPFREEGLDLPSFTSTFPLAEDGEVGKFPWAALHALLA